MIETSLYPYLDNHVTSNRMKMSIQTKIVHSFGFLLFAMMIVTPSAFQIPKVVILAILFIVILVDMLINRRRRLHPLIFKYFLFYISLGLIFGIYGYLRGNVGVIPITKEVVLYVILYMILIRGIVDYASVKYMHKTLVISMVLLSLYIVTSILNAYGIWPDWLYYNLQTETSNEDISVDTLHFYGVVSTSFDSFPSLLFLQPYLFTYLVSNNQKKSKPLWALFIVLTIIMIFVGRRILLITAILAPVIIIFVLNKIPTERSLKVRNWKSLIFFSFLVMIGSAYILIRISGISVQATIEDFLYSFQSIQVNARGEYVSNPRLETIYYLFNGWKESPIFGFGSGASHPTYYRSKYEPWNYEVLYMQFLYSWGLLGCTLYGVGILFIIKKLFLIYKECSNYSSIAISALFGMCAFLIGSFTNPYLLKYDMLYTIFLPVAIINVRYLRK